MAGVELRQQAIEAVARRRLASLAGGTRIDIADERFQRRLQLEQRGTMCLDRLGTAAARAVDWTLKLISIPAGAALSPALGALLLCSLAWLWQFLDFDLAGGWWGYIARHTPLDFFVLSTALCLVAAIPYALLGLPLYTALRLYRAADRVFAGGRYVRRCVPSDDDPAYVRAGYRHELHWGPCGEQVAEAAGGVAMVLGTLVSAFLHALGAWLFLKACAQLWTWSVPETDPVTRFGAIVLWIVLFVVICALIGGCFGPRKGGRALQNFVEAVFAGAGLREALREALRGDG